MKPGEIILKATSKKGTPITIRYIKTGDEVNMCNYINELSKEHTYITFQGEEISLAEEKEYVDSQIERIEKGISVHLIVLYNEEQIGISSIDLRGRVESHVADFGISIKNEFRGQGIGKMFLDTILSEAQKNLIGLKIINLGVFANNTQAIKMYNDVGFKEYGVLPKGIKYRNELVDHILMYKEI